MEPTPLRLEIVQTWDGVPIPAEHHVQLSLAVTADALQIAVDAPFYGDPAPTGPPGPTDGLWSHEVVELFIAGGTDAYLEVELGPHGHHLVLQLAGIRQASATGLPIDFQATVRGHRWTGTASVPRSLLPPGPLRINATAIHGTGDDRTYLSIATLPGEAPDFHQPDRFGVALRLT